MYKADKMLCFSVNGIGFKTGKVVETYSGSSMPISKINIPAINCYCQIQAAVVFTVSAFSTSRSAV